MKIETLCQLLVNKGWWYINFRESFSFLCDSVSVTTIQSFACETWEHGGSEFEAQLGSFYRTLDTETDHLSWGELCGRLVQATKLVEEDVRVDIATRDAAQVIVTT